MKHRCISIKKVLWIIVPLLLFLPPSLKFFIKKEARHLEGIQIEDVQFREVFFKNEQQNLNLAGLLFEPEGDGPFPAAVIIHGSGSNFRENSWYLTLCHFL